jgi:hypothetical protein
MGDCGQTDTKRVQLEAVGRPRLQHLLVLSLVLLGIAGAAAVPAGAAVEAPPPPRVWSDQADYAPGALVTLAGTDWAPGETVRVVVNDDGGQTWRREVDVTADEAGAIADQFTLPDWFVATYSVTATGPISGTATTVFSDGNIEFQLATNGQSAPANVSWKVTWNHWQGTGNVPNQTCASSPDITGGTTSYNGNTLASGSSRPSVNANGSAAPTNADTTGANAGTYVLDYWTATATGGAASALSPAQLCTAGQNGGQTVRTLYAHFKLADSTPPTTDASATAGGGAYISGSWTNQNVTLVLTAEDNPGGSGVKEIHYSVGGGPETAVAGASASISFSSEGTTTVSYFARDNAGNSEAPRTFVIKIDKTPPVVTISTDRGPDSNGWYNHPVEVSAAGDDGTGSGSVYCDPPATYGGPDDAVATVFLACRDVAGNEGSATASLQYDATPLSSSASSAEFGNGPQIGVSYSVAGAEADTSGLDAVELWVRGPSDSSFHIAPNPAATDASGSFGYDVDQGEGIYRFYTIAVDAAANREADPVDPDDSGRVSTTLQDETAPTTSDDADAAWHNEAVTLHLTASDDGSGVAATYVGIDGAALVPGAEAVVPAPADHTNDGRHTITYYSVDRAGNEDAARTATVRIDTTAPSVVDTGPAPAQPDGDNGWYRQAVVTSFEASDGASGLDAACAAAFPSEGGDNVKAVSSEGEQGATVRVESGPCADTAGNVNAGVESDPYAIDFTDPSITMASRLPAPNANGWNNTSVTVLWTCSDQEGLSGVVSLEVTRTFADEGVHQSADGTCRDEAGNTSTGTSGPVSIDETKPVIAGARAPTANAFGWNNADVAVTFSCADTGTIESGIDVDTVAGETVTTERRDQSVTNSGRCLDRAGNSAETATVGDISIDKTPPTIAFSSRFPSANAEGWNKSDVTVTWACADQEGLAGVTVEATADTIMTEGADQTARGTCTDRADNEASDVVAGISIDKTAPTISIVSPTDGGAYSWTHPTAAGYSCTDALSGAAGCSGPVPSRANFVALPAGSKSFQVHASDKAGNAAATASAYTVTYDFDGFFQPIDMGPTVLNVAKSGSSIPVKFKLGGNAGLNVFAAGYPVSTQIACTSASTLDAIETTTTSNSGLTYDLLADQYVYVWKTNSAWAGSCRQFRAAFADGRVVTANFKFAK